MSYLDIAANYCNMSSKTQQTKWEYRSFEGPMQGFTLVRGPNCRTCIQKTQKWRYHLLMIPRQGSNLEEIQMIKNDYGPQCIACMLTILLTLPKCGEFYSTFSIDVPKSHQSLHKCAPYITLNCETICSSELNRL